jgi:hypothetical protein
MSILIESILAALSAYAVGVVVACAWAWLRGQDPDPAHKGLEHDA